ncbi:TonB-dependent receptor domain-containing protein [Steroidobacter agaridevorans]|uniref:TonB-dependent receptor domain-containing protein n=1 Tax=Steroidobacter agaridevorans TaxID=2695856 RepID=UPI001323ED55|nr:TonB-dependent receptor [Steroidobacter agaridevorans]GFE89012.1 TonB-dependent receptor [Steroidobacter agaridevorans]
MLRAIIASLLAVASAGALAQTNPTSTDQTRQEFNIAAQPLSQALREYAQQSGDQVVFYSEIGKGREAPALSGSYTRQEALQRLLENTGLKYRRVNAKTIAISTDAPARPEASMQRTSMAAPMRLAQATEPAPAPLPQTQEQGGGGEQAPADSLFGVEEVIVTGTAVAERTKFDSSVAISTFNAEDIAQQAPSSSADLISAVPGFWVESTAGTTQGNVFARGIIQDGGYRYVGLMEDGIPIYPVFELSFYNPDQFVRVDDTIERVEALRGGTAPIFTAGAVGGTVNFVTQTAKDSARGSVKLGFSDYGMYRGDVAWSAPLGDDWGIALGGYYRTSDGVRDPGYTADEGGQFRVKLDRSFDNGSIEFFGKYIDDRSLFVVPIPLTGDPSDPRGVNGADAGTYSLHSEDLARAGLPVTAAEVGLRGSNLEDGIHPQLATIGGKLNWQFNDTVSVTNLLRYTDGEVRFDGIFPGDPPETGAVFAADLGVAANYTVLSTGAPYAANQLVQNHGHWVVNKEFDAIQDDLRLNLNFDTHAVTFGLYVADYSMQDAWSLGNSILMDVSDQPRRLALPGVTDANGFTKYSTFNLLTDYDAMAYSLYAADEWQVTDALRFDFGVRYDTQDIEGTVRAGSQEVAPGVPTDLDGNPATTYDRGVSLIGANRSTVDEDFDNTGFSIGFNYEFTPRHGMFGHYTDSAKLPHFDDVRNGVLQKDQVTNIELGYKASLETLVVFATLFQTEFDNVPFQDILANGQTIVRRAETRTRGVELEGEFQPSDALGIRFSITQQDPTYEGFTGSAAGNTGNVIRRIPKTMARITPTYTFMDGAARAYFTYTYAGKRFANDENSIELPKYTKLDAGVMFDVGANWTFQVTGDNLTDEIGLTEGNPRTDVGSGGIGNIYMVRPLFGRSFMGSVTYRWP